MPGPVKRKALRDRADRAAAGGLFERVQEAVGFLRATMAGRPPEVGIILGSGLGALGETLTDARAVPYLRIPHFPAARVAGHASRLILGRLEGRPVAVMQGRPHQYEGYSPAQVGFPVRVLRGLGVRALLVSNVAGGLNPAFRAGDLMLIEDVINLTGDNPLRGPNDERLGPRFPAMHDLFSARLLAAARAVARQGRIVLRRGVYAGMSGPSYETAAELRMLRRLGADAVGMSTVPEIIVARHAGIPEILGISCITNVEGGRRTASLDHAAVLKAAQAAEARFVALLRGVIARC
ncbi:MAG: purine-nucleoside phosphorylase [Candidatus Methylomirabilota bacterium]